MLDESSKVGLCRSGSAKAGAATRGLADGLDDRRKGVAKDHRPPGAEHVEITIAVLVIEICTLGARNEGRIAADGAEGADGRIDPSGKKGFGALLQLAGAIESERHLIQYKRLWRSDDGG